MHRLVSFFLLLCFFGTDADCAQRIIAGFRFKSLDRQGVVYLGKYLEQIECVAKRYLYENQVKLILEEFDSSGLRVLKKQELARARKDFYRNRVEIVADWSYFTQQRLLDLHEPGEVAWDLHHIIFLRLNGPNCWWNIIPLVRKGHQAIIHGKDQPGELLHNYLADRFSKYTP